MLRDSVGLVLLLTSVASAQTAAPTAPAPIEVCWQKCHVADQALIVDCVNACQSCCSVSGCHDACFLGTKAAAILVTPAPTPTPLPPCAGQLMLWTPYEHQDAGWLQGAARAEGICRNGRGALWGRGDVYALKPGAALSSDTLDLQHIGAAEEWLGASYEFAEVKGLHLAAAAFAGLHESVSSGTLAGGTSLSGCGGLRVDYGHDYSVGGVCNAYPPLGPGAPLVTTIVLSVKGPVGVAMNGVYIPQTRRHLWAVGPTAGWK